MFILTFKGVYGTDVEQQYYLEGEISAVWDHKVES